MRRLRQVLAVYLAVTFVLAGAAGLNPLLHQWLEHGGRDPAHVHHGAGAAQQVRVQGRLARGHAPFTLPKVSAQWLRQLAHRLAHAAEESREPAAPTDAPGHEHHSLAQTLASGLVEAPALVELSLSVAPGTLRDATRVPARASARELDRQTAGRAPPTALG
jgi:hypothetical protein